jgi:hypothetical protein
MLQEIWKILGGIFYKGAMETGTGSLVVHPRGARKAASAVDERHAGIDRSSRP